MFDAAVPWLLASGGAAWIELAIDHVRSRIASPGALAPSVGANVALAAGHVFAQALILGAGTLAWTCGSEVGKRVRWPSLGTIVVPAAVLFAVVAWPLLLAGQGLASGAWIAEQSFAPLVRLAPLCAALVAMPVLAAVVTSGTKPTGWRRKALLTMLFAGAAACIVADHRVFPGLYPEFHMVAYAAGAIAVALGMRTLLDRRAEWITRPWVRRLAIVFAAGFVASPWLWFFASNRTRAELVLYSPTAKDFIQTTMPVRKATPLRAALEDLDVAAGTLDGGGADLPRGRITGAEDMNVMFVVVDTLRADAVPPVRPAEGTKFAKPSDTPFLDEWLAQTYRFSRCYTGAPTTRMAIPALFRSVEVSDDLVKQGIPAGQRFESMGLTPIAVVLDWFVAGKWPAAAALLDGFEDVVVYEQSESDRVVEHARSLLEPLDGRRFFFWAHLFEVHDPGFDGHLMTSKDGSRIERYRRSLRYLDGNFRRLTELLDELKLSDNTIIVFVGDHGEGLGEHGLQLHGPNLFDEDLHVPLAIYIPGREGVVVDSLVGLKDVVPTVVDLLGAPIDPGDRGRSLVPLMAGDTDDTPHAYYFQNDDDKKFGLIVGNDKLFWERRNDLIFRSDLVEDPDERAYLYDPEGEVDRALMRKLIEFNPGLVKEELEDEETYALLAQRLAEVDPKDPGAALPFVLRLVALHPTDETVDTAVEIFDAADDPRVRLLVLRTVGAAQPRRFEKAVAAWIDEIAGTSAELELVAALARQAQGKVAAPRVVARMQHWVDNGTPADWEPYLLLVRTWAKTAKGFAGVFATMLRSATASPDAPPRIAELLLDNIASIKPGKTESSPELDDLKAQVRAMLDHPEPRVRTGAVRAIGGLGDETSTPQIRAKLHDAKENPRVRYEAAASLVTLADKAAIPDLEQAAHDPVLTAAALRQFKRLGDPTVIPFLESLKDEHASGWVRLEIGRVIKELQKKTKRGGKPKSKPKAKPSPRKPGSAKPPAPAPRLE